MPLDYYLSEVHTKKEKPNFHKKLVKRENNMKYFVNLNYALFMSQVLVLLRYNKNFSFHLSWNNYISIIVFTIVLVDQPRYSKHTRLRQLIQTIVESTLNLEPWTLDQCQETVCANPLTINETIKPDWFEV